MSERSLASIHERLYLLDAPIEVEGKVFDCNGLKKEMHEHGATLLRQGILETFMYTVPDTNLRARVRGFTDKHGGPTKWSWAVKEPFAPKSPHVSFRLESERNGAHSKKEAKADLMVFLRELLGSDAGVSSRGSSIKKRTSFAGSDYGTLVGAQFDFDTYTHFNGDLLRSRVRVLEIEGWNESEVLGAAAAVGISPERVTSAPINKIIR